MKAKNTNNTADLKFLELCYEIDCWKQEAEYYKNLYNESQKDYNELLNRGIADGQKTVGSLLSLMLNASTIEEGTIIKIKP